MESSNKFGDIIMFAVKAAAIGLVIASVAFYTGYRAGRNSAFKESRVLIEQYFEKVK